MNQKNEERRNKILRFAIVGALSVGFVCMFIGGFIFQFHESMKYIVSMGASPDELRAAFLKGALIGGLFGSFVGGSVGASFGGWRETS